MNELRRILWLTAFAAVVLLTAGKAAAQNYVTPTVKPTPPGQLIVVNNGAGVNHTDPHVDGDLVCYTNQQAVTSIHYHDLTSGTDNGIPLPNGGLVDFLCDVRGTTIVFTRDGIEADIFSFDTGSSTLTSFFPQPNSLRFSGQIGDQTIAWQEFTTSLLASTIVAYDRASGTTTIISPASPPVGQYPAISRDGSVVVWEGCTIPITATSCVIWKAIRSGAGAWSSQELASQFAAESHPDTDGTIIAYGSRGSTEQLAWQPVAGGIEQVLNIPGSVINPSVSGGLIAFAYDATGSGVSHIVIYNVAANILYDVTADLVAAGLYPSGNDHSLNDISVTPDGKARVVWQVQENGQSNVYAYTFNLPAVDFNFNAISPLTISGGASASTNVTVNSVNGFGSAVNLSVSGQPAGVNASLSANSVTPSSGNPSSSILNVSVSPALAPTNFTLTVTGTSGTLTHSATANVTVTATTSSVGNLIGNLLGAGCIDNGGIANALTSKLSAAQSAGSVQAAINTLTALKNQINAQAGKHIATACNIGGMAFNPVTVLLLDVQALIDSLRVSATPDPITGYVVDANGVGVAGAVVSMILVDQNGQPVQTVATAMTDITGFYFFATMSVLNPGSSYGVSVSGLPPGFATSTPVMSPAFVWSGSGLMIGTFVLQ